VPKGEELLNGYLSLGCNFSGTFVFLLFVCFSEPADYIRISSEKQIVGTTATIGPGYFYSDKEFTGLLLEIAEMKKLAEISRLKSQYLESVVELQKQHISRLDKTASSLEENSKESDAIRDELEKNRKELESVFNKQIGNLKTQNRLMSLENGIYKTLLGASIVFYLGREK
jgi:vacuolar-type H+-ATPase subunit I/STV1